MSTIGRLLDWLLPRLICLCPMGAIAYHNADVAQGASMATGPGEHALLIHQRVRGVPTPIIRPAGGVPRLGA